MSAIKLKYFPKFSGLCYSLRKGFKVKPLYYDEVVVNEAEMQGGWANAKQEMQKQIHIRFQHLS